ncbi:hypothetical protein HELRODRAFT_189478 [Helobdella robusta]|uniref:Uncharacterized protein n=1 Tax=Helobdella robusta TaxID=6412 RepID=T1FR32_HELRO|nr:hypothetical protein HELRODRAFT_189478 [Helobdella robusta]ESN94676.1 hypothetical protein HELRODRAFT_189478 [Helobdella robusta]
MVFLQNENCVGSTFDKNWKTSIFSPLREKDKSQIEETKSLTGESELQKSELSQKLDSKITVGSGWFSVKFLFPWQDVFYDNEGGESFMSLFCRDEIGKVKHQPVYRPFSKSYKAVESYKLSIVPENRCQIFPLFKINICESEECKIEKCLTLCVSSNDEIVVADSTEPKLKFFSKEGKRLREIDHKVQKPARISTCPLTENIVLFCNEPTFMIKVFSPIGKPSHAFVCKIDSKIVDMCIDTKGQFLLLTRKKNQVLTYNAVGKLISYFDVEEVMWESRITVNKQGKIFISDVVEHCIHVHSYDGQYIRKIGGLGTTNYPAFIKIGLNNELIVCSNNSFFNVTIFDQNGTFMGGLASSVDIGQCVDACLIAESSLVVTTNDGFLYFFKLPCSVMDKLIAPGKKCPKTDKISEEMEKEVITLLNDDNNEKCITEDKTSLTVEKFLNVKKSNSSESIDVMHISDESEPEESDFSLISLHNDFANKNLSNIARLWNDISGDELTTSHRNLWNSQLGYFSSE